MVEKEIKLTCGLEIHQQLDSHKLFCNCPSILRKDEPDIIVNRKLHAVAGEGGVVDVAVKHESENDLEFVYQGFSDTTCLFELDEEPPQLINQEALKIAMHISLLLNCDIVPITQIMRKTVVDGSNTSGFQRTVLIGRNGYLEINGKKIGISHVYLEEDAARKVSEENKIITYRLDRLGIPLVEVVTAPDITTPQQSREVALKIGEILRSCKVKRGLGTIRQDINISIPNHPRAEIKGFQDPKIFVNVINNEINRQKKDLKNNKKDLIPEVRGANEDSTTKFLRPLPGSARMYPETDLPILKISKKLIDEAKKSLPILISDIENKLSKKGLTSEMIKLLLKGNKLNEFEDLLKIYSEPKFIYQVLIEIPKEIASHEGIDVSKKLNLEIIEDIVDAISEGKISKSDVKHIMEELVKGKSLDQALKIEKVELEDLEAEIATIIKDKPGLSIGGYMGLIMAKFKGKVSGGEVSEILKKLMK